MEYSPTFSASQETLPLLCNPKFHYRAYKTPTLDPILSHMNPLYVITFYFFKLYFIIIFPSTPRFSKWSFFPSGFPAKIL